MTAQPRVYSVKELNKYIRMKLENDIVLGDVWLRGEISNFTHHSSGHMYFTLKDEGSRLKCVMFASHNARLPFIPREGAKVLARGNISVFERDGNYQFYCMAMQPDGIGSLYLAFEQLKEKLDQEGLFAASRKRSLPAFPKAIGVITSPTGAAVRDITTTLKRRYPIIPVYVYPVLVQGAGAAPAIVNAIQAMNRFGECDVLIVGRGGGSLEELWAFNEEAVARAIADSAIPVISAVGHETDYTISDFVSDLRAATPTAAAELAVPHVAELGQGLERLKQRLDGAMRLRLRKDAERLERARRSPFFRYPRKYLLEQAQRLDRLQEQLRSRTERVVVRERARLDKLGKGLVARHPGERIAFSAKRLATAAHRLELAASGLIKEKKQRLGAGVRQLDALSPLKVMARGYGLVYDNEGKTLLKTVQGTQEGDEVTVKLSDGSLECRVLSVKGE
ncbi:exodeoxyribonuclease VII large subunit [Paenibacillus sp. PAMC21692]|uniref:exodeoxyribonuclease VII large subunit n=1 Tax=Paenibacillus sp. PAMC21692 TaxID=2762320 RepID=UPI00164D9E35|nr:exodeoxyribonuclease VII large subunit [Paenibacillus sp. PAMC21692]QNK55446.1 exodeoxyribonuclease VII large subunit [Paenibacillus sp. PAMC21692]